MRHRVPNYTINGQYIILDTDITIEDVRLIINETQKTVICSSMNKENISIDGNVIKVDESVCTLAEGDKITFEIDKGDDTTELAKEATLNEVSSKIDNIKLPEIDTTELAKQGDNQEATNSKILEEVQNKLTPLEAVLTELNNGKQEMVDALAMKNVQSSTDKTLSAIASDIRSIAQLPITIDGGEMYEKQLFGAPTDKTNAYEQPDSPMWNLYKVMADLKNDGRFTEYNGILLAEFQKWSESIVLSGAGSSGAYYTSDGAFYEIDKGAGDPHIWNDADDGKINRWVAYLFANVGSDFNIITESLSPLSIHIGRTVGALYVSGVSLIENIVVGDEDTLEKLNFTGISSSGWGTKINLKVNELDGVEFLSHASTKIANIDCKTIPNRPFLYGCPEVLRIKGMKNYAGGANRSLITNNSSCKCIILEDAEELHHISQDSQPTLEIIKAPSLKKSGTDYFGKLMTGSFKNLIDIEVGEMETDLMLDNWASTDVLADATKVLQLDKNIREHIAQKVQDRTDLAPLTVTLSQGIRNILTEETEQAFTAKNWNIAPAKSV